MLSHSFIESLIYSFTYSSNKYLLSTCYMPNIALGTGDTAVNGTDQSPAFKGLVCRAWAPQGPLGVSEVKTLFAMMLRLYLPSSPCWHCLEGTRARAGMTAGPQQRMSDWIQKQVWESVCLFFFLAMPLHVEVPRHRGRTHTTAVTTLNP